MKKETKSTEVEAVMMRCSYCGLRWVVEKDILFDDGKGKCPNCGIVYNLF